uniref:Ig-like domain-containing protein n=1 Tax=Cyprinus carpio TaxID=7962 RepID=A0A8C1SME6_CYPCA
MKCALKGSTIHLSGSYKHPNYLTVAERFWIVNPNKDESINLLNHPDYSGRVQYSPDKEQTCVLKLSNVTHEDEGMYCIRIVANVEKQRYLGFPGIDLKVTELRVEIPEEVVEGESSVLVCKTTCNLSDKTNFTWYKNSKSLSESIDSYQLLLQSVSSDDSGNYSCAVRDQKHLLSPAVTLSVRYPPKSVSVSISPSGEIVEGDSVTLSCSSDSNPPALNFSWFKENQSSAVGSGQSFIISSFNSSHRGRYYCEAQNKHGSQRSASVSVSVKEGEGDSVSCQKDSESVCVHVHFFFSLRKRVTPSEEQKHRGSGHKTLESPEDAYMSLEPKSRCSEYDTLDNMKRSCENTDHPEAQDPIYHNTVQN